jgi:hypothetical protein
MDGSDKASGDAVESSGIQQQETARKWHFIEGEFDKTGNGRPAF